MIPTYVIVSTHNKPDKLTALIESVRNQVDHIFVIDNASWLPLLGDQEVAVIRDNEQPPNLSRLWNIGLTAIAGQAKDQWNVFVVNDDVIVPEGWVAHATSALRNSGAAVVFPDQFARIDAPWLNTVQGQVSAYDRMCGFAHIAKGELGVRFDENMRWWYSDDDYDWQCRALGGSMMLPHMPVVHTSPNQSMDARPELSVQAGKDRETFISKWGTPPC